MAKSTLEVKMSLYKIVREILDETELSDPHEIAQEVLKRTTKTEQNEFLIQELAQIVKKSMHSLRNNSFSYQGTSKWKNVSPLFRNPVCVNGIYKPLGDCKIDEVWDLANERRAKAKEIELMADKYELLAKTMKSAGVKKVKDLPEDEVREILQ